MQLKFLIVRTSNGTSKGNYQPNMITKVYISKSKSKTAIAFFDDLAKQKAETIKKVEDKTRHLRERLLKTNAK